jgi:hypothetical protein
VAAGARGAASGGAVGPGANVTGMERRSNEPRLGEGSFERLLRSSCVPFVVTVVTSNLRLL